MSDPWDGIERRSQAIIDQFTRKLLEHTKDEMERYDAIIKKYDQLEDRLGHMDERLSQIERGQAEVTHSIQSFMDTHSSFIKAIQRAFPKDEDGNPDYDGHKKAHLEWISNAKDEKELMEFVRRQMKDAEKSEDLLNYTKKIIFASAALAVASFIAVATWAAFLKGPV